MLEARGLLRQEAGQWLEEMYSRLTISNVWLYGIQLEKSTVMMHKLPFRCRRISGFQLNRVPCEFLALGDSEMPHFSGVLN